MKVVGLVGQKRSGKDTVAEVFESLGWYRTSFAKALYREVSEAFGISVSELQDHGMKEVPWLDLSACKDLEFLELAKPCQGFTRSTREIHWVSNPKT